MISHQESKPSAVRKFLVEVQFSQSVVGCYARERYEITAATEDDAVVRAAKIAQESNYVVERIVHTIQAEVLHELAPWQPQVNR